MDKVGLVHVALPSQMHPASVVMEMGLASLPPRRLCSLRKETGFQRTQSHRLREGILARRGGVRCSSPVRLQDGASDPTCILPSLHRGGHCGLTIGGPRAHLRRRVDTQNV